MFAPSDLWMPLKSSAIFKNTGIAGCCLVLKVRPIRIAIGGMQLLLGEIIVAAVEGEPDMIFVGSVDGYETIDAGLTDLSADVLISSETVLTSEQAARLLARRPEVELFAISQGGHYATRYEPKGTQIMGDVAPSKIILEIRTALGAAAAERETLLDPSNCGKRKPNVRPPRKQRPD